MTETAIILGGEMSKTEPNRIPKNPFKMSLPMHKVPIVFGGHWLTRSYSRAHSESIVSGPYFVQDFPAPCSISSRIPRSGRRGQGPESRNQFWGLAAKLASIAAVEGSLFPLGLAYSCALYYKVPDLLLGEGGGGGNNPPPEWPPRCGL